MCTILDKQIPKYLNEIRNPEISESEKYENHIEHAAWKWN